MLQLISIGLLYFFALVGVAALVLSLGLLYVLYAFDVRINVGNLNTREEETEKKVAVKDASAQKA